MHNKHHSYTQFYTVHNKNKSINKYCTKGLYEWIKLRSRKENRKYPPTQGRLKINYVLQWCKYGVVIFTLLLIWRVNAACNQVACNISDINSVIPCEIKILLLACFGSCTSLKLGNFNLTRKQHTISIVQANTCHLNAEIGILLMLFTLHHIRMLDNYHSCQFMAGLPSHDLCVNNQCDWYASNFCTTPGTAAEAVMCQETTSLYQRVWKAANHLADWFLLLQRINGYWICE